MGLLVEGEWRDRWYDTKESGGRFKRQAQAFRASVTADGSGPHPAASGRYRLYVSLACPWAHRTLIVRRLKGLEEAIPVSVVSPRMAEFGWVFEGYPGADPVEPLHGGTRLYELYQKADPSFTGRVTVPVLWDAEAGTIVNNESSEVIRLLNAAFDAFAADPDLDLYPEELRGEIDRVNAEVYEDVNNGVYKAGFATTEEAYEEAFDALFARLDRLEALLAERRYLAGDRLTEADVRLYTTLVRFDPVYVGHFKCNKRRIVDYPNLTGYLRELYQMPAFTSTTDLGHIKTHYYWSHTTINPTRIVPKGPDLGLEAPHGRDIF